MNLFGFAKHAIRVGIRTLGYDVVRSRDTRPMGELPNRISGGGARLVVHLLGVQGVGKTTISQEVVRVSKEGVKLFTGDNRVNPAGSNWFLGENGIPRPIERVLELKLGSITQDERRSVHAKFRHLFYMYQVVTNHVWFKSVGYDGVALMDSALLQHFAAELCLLHGEDTLAFAELVSDCVIVHCTSDLQTVMRYIVRRNKGGLRIPSHWGQSDEEIEARTRTRLSEMTHFVNLARQAGVPCLEIDTSENIVDNARKVCAFIQAEAAHVGH
jgi:hypothetical protein